MFTGENIKNMEKRCHICNMASFFLLEKDGYSLFRCLSCGLVFVFPSLENNYLKTDVYSFESGYQGNRKGDLMEFMKENYNGRFDKTIDYIKSIKKEGNLLDVGCSNGEFIYLAKQHGYNVFGVELNPKTANAAISSGLNVYIGFLNDAKFSDNFFDIVVLNDVIEHLSNPRDVLVECNRILKPGGVIVIKTPNLDCFWSRSTFYLFKIFKIPWSSITPPHHLYYFSLNNLSSFLGNIGFAFKKVWYDPAPPLGYELGSLHLLRRYKNEKKLKNLLFMIFSFGLYSVFWSFDFLIRPLVNKNFEMTLVYSKKI